MNTPNNKRKKESQDKIEKTFVQLLQSKDLEKISVTDICEKCNLNRSTFYANYIDIYDLVDKVKEKLENDVSELYNDEVTHNYNSNNFLKLFQHIKENQIFYKTYFKLGFDNHSTVFKYDINLAQKFFDNKFLEYHIEFFKAGLNSIIKLWLKNDCRESPEEINSILESEYMVREQD